MFHEICFQSNFDLTWINPPFLWLLSPRRQKKLRINLPTPPPSPHTKFQPEIKLYPYQNATDAKCLRHT